jgi:hypothetical protein
VSRNAAMDQISWKNAKSSDSVVYHWGINQVENAGNARSRGSLAVSQASQSDRVVL